ncbi:MAG: hypothetical protein ABR582_02585 [Gemmatimonadaceae bacterium]
MRIRFSLAALLLAVAAPCLVQAQQRPAIRPIGAVVAKATEPFGGINGVRQLSDGRVLVNDVAKRRVLMFDPSLGTFTVIADSTSATANAYSGRFGGIISYKGDSTIFVDPTSLSMLVIDGSGKVARVMSVPRSQDAGALAIGNAVIDAAGRIVYRGPPNLRPPNFANGVPTAPDIPDSAAIVRIDLATRKLDTAGFIKTPKIKFDISRDDNGGVRIQTQTNPLPIIDDWAVLPDGTIAFVRGHDYHVDYVNPDGTKTSSAKIPFEWQRMTDEDKVAFLDSLKAARARLGTNAPTIGFGGGAGGGAPQMVIVGGTAPAAGGGAGRDGGTPRGDAGNVRINGPGGGPAGNLQLNFVPASELPDYKPPFFGGSVRADTEGNLWIRTIPTKAIPGGPVYDVINKKGELVERVQVPENRTLVGFGAGGTAYLAVRDSPTATSVYLERVKVR